MDFLSETNALPVKEATKTVRDIKTQEMSHGTQRHLLQLDHEGLVQSQSSIHVRQSVQSPDVKGEQHHLITNLKG